MPVPKFKTLGIRNNNPEQRSKPGAEEEIKIETELSQLALKVNERKSNIPFNLKIIPRSKLVFHEKNDYQQVDIEKLADGILHFGLIHSLEGYYDEEQDKYIIESGERRTRAIDLLLERFSDFEDKDSQEYKDFLVNVKGFEVGYPINVKKRRFISGAEELGLDEIDSEIRLMDANEEVRPSDPKDKYKRVMRRSQLMEQRNALLPYKDRTNINKEVGNQLGMSERQVQKYKNLNDLIPELKEEFFHNHITLTEGANYSSLTEEEQRNILKLIQEGKKVSADDIKMLKKEKEAAAAELMAKEQELEDLKNESRRLQAEHSKRLEEMQKVIKKEKERLAEELKAEIQNNSPDRKKVEELEALMKEKELTEKINRERLDSVQLSLSNKEDEIKRLEDQLERIRDKPVQDLELIKKEAQLAASIENLVTAAAGVKKTFKTFAGAGDVNQYRIGISKVIHELDGLIKMKKA